ncbi:MAG TPA: carboxypeptidase-like regulatory domain-containing protein [Gemmatimonadales bacterium]|nr:carboxypeptidase-like regulatory domain-containing protein [Gemmatimonadales bacterium]
MKGRHVVILVFVFGLSLMAILFRMLPQAKVPPPPLAAPPPVEIPSPPRPEPPVAENSGILEVFVKARGTPVSGATVGFQVGARSFQLTSGAQGRCLVPRAEPGPWRVVARAEGAAAPSKLVTVETGRTATLELELEAGVRLMGVVRDGAGVPVSGARVSMSLPDPAFTTRTDAGGNYILHNLPTGIHAITASSERLRPQTLPRLELATPGKTETQDFTLQFGAMLSGIVVDDAGTPVSRASVTISNEVARVVRTDGNGEFRVDGLGEGPITVSVVARGFAPAARRAIPPGQEGVRIQLVRGATIEGRIDGEPEAFTVHLSRYDDGLSRWLLVRSERFAKDLNGAFELRDLAPGRYEATLETLGRHTAVPLTFELEAGQTVRAGLVVLGSK